MEMPPMNFIYLILGICLTISGMACLFCIYLYIYMESKLKKKDESENF